ncbi:hypothetical protein CDL12_10347 [Handroanthus impetiginosus]|uniref:J domain-containing protein n=1 Tax=Handroanthus impetiginosus TaxID=429701 RepID=A0A2G9HHT5_9LAMI|nr:hypothetical protein CDL12_10347 [Handroanthus impetiginosus]
MDEFGVLVESIGFRAQGKSAPMAKLKPKPKSHFTAHSTSKTSSFDDSYSLPVEELDGIFRSNVNISGTRQSQNIVDDDIFGGPVSSSNGYAGVDLESVFSSSNNRKDNSGNLNSRNSVGSHSYDDLLGLKSKQRDPVDGFFGSFELNSSGKQEKEEPGLDDLVSGFGGATPAKTEVFSEKNLFPESHGGPSAVIDDPFLVFESSVSQSDASWPFAGPSDQHTGKGSVQSSIDDFGDFTMPGARSGSKVDGIRTTANNLSSGTSSKGFENANYLDEIFGSGDAVQQNNAARPSSSAKNPLFDDFFHEEKISEVKQTSSLSSFSTKKASTSTNVGNDFTSLFGDFAASSGEFQEIEGEPEDRRRARLNRHIRMNARMAEALAEKNQRDLESQREQEEKRRLAEILENDIKRWAAGKEGNLRALLSSLEQVLWAECGWRPVSLTDMITSESVKKVYKKATLYVHPDKVQQKGATLQQKYIAEKVFDILKEAWNKFSTEELR